MPASKPIRLFDGGGAYREVSPSSGKGWRLKYRYVGGHPEAPLAGRTDKAGGGQIKGARDRRDQAN